MIKLVVTDLDGTVVGKDEVLPPVFVEAVKAWRQRGLLYTFATGRASDQVRAYAQRLELCIPHITCNGGVVLQGSQVLTRQTMPVAPLGEILRTADAMGMSLLYTVDGEEIAHRETDYVLAQREAFGRYPSPRPVEETGACGLEKLIVMARVRDSSMDVIETLCKQLPREYYYKRYANKAVDILPQKASKERAVAELARSLGIGMNEVLAAGDDLNDLEMLREAGVGVAVGNALDCVKAAADYVAQGQRHLGVMEAVERFCKEEETLCR